MSNFLYDATNSNGFILSTPLALAATTDLSGITNGSAVTLTGGSSGVFKQSDTGSGISGYVMLKTVTTGWTPTAGGALFGWFAASPDAGTTFEIIKSTPSATVPALPRPPDFTIPFDAAATGTGLIRSSSLILIPAYQFKVIVQNLTGATTGAGNHTLQLCPVGVVRA
jgi:hypothetical protein